MTSMERARRHVAPSEATPLIQSVPVAEHRERYPHQWLRRYCTFALATIPLLTLIIILIVIAIGGQSDLFGDHDSESLFSTKDIALPHSRWPESQGLSYSDLKKLLLDTPDPKKAREWSQYYTAGPHLCGKNLSQAEWTRDRWEEFGIPQADIVSYDVYLNYPVNHRLRLLEHGYESFRASLEEQVLAEDPTTSLEDRIPTFHGYSASGDVTASFVYCNYGTYADFEDLQKAGIDLEGKIAIVRYGGIFRGLKVKRAEDLGMIGVIIYSDPGTGEFTEANGYKQYPNGPAMNPTYVQRGSVEYLSVAPGDPTTIGYPSKPGVPRQSTDGKIPKIPSLPISYLDALPLLKALNGHGPNATSFSSRWQDGGLGYKGVDYSVGPSPNHLKINLMNKQEYVTTPAWNVIGIINGTIEDEVVVIGNHRDAWIAGGAVDPNSGSASLNEVVRAFGAAVQEGWKPLRTIVFASWDGEEYGLIGSTEWVEEYIPWLSDTAVAYINVDVSTAGRFFHTSAAPLLNKAIFEVTSEVQSPNQTVEGQTVRDLWSGYISTMGSGSDFTAFQDFAGIPSIDVGFTQGPGDPVYHYHSNYDSFYWVDEFGDPGFEYHIAISKILGLLAAKLSEEAIVQFSASDYASGLEKYVQNVKDLAAETEPFSTMSWDMYEPLDAAVQRLKEASDQLDRKAQDLSALFGTMNDLGRDSKSYKEARKVNTKYKYLERQFLWPRGLDSRSWFKHVVFAPGLWTGYAGVTFPGLAEAIEEKDDTAFLKWLHIVTRSVDKATDLIRHDS